MTLEFRRVVSKLRELIILLLHGKIMATQDAQVIVKALEDCRKRNKGQYIDNVCSFCKKEFDWDRPKSMAAIETAKEIGLVRQVNNSDKCLRIVETCIESTPPTPDERIESSSPSKTIGEIDEKEDLVDFKKYIHSELLSIKAHVFNRSLSETVTNGSNNFNYEKMFIKSLEDRIVSLEKQLHHKQRIIDKLLEQPSRIAETTSSPAIPTTHDLPGGAVKNSSSSKEKNNLQETSQKCMGKNPQSTVSSKGKGNNNLHGGNSSHNKSKQNQTDPANQQRKTIIVVGDSILNGINENGLSKNAKKHNVKVRAHPGATSRDLIDHIKPVARRKPSLIVVHVGTNDITNNVDTEEMLQTLVNDVKKESPDTEIAISGLVTRKDKPGIEKKVSSLNTCLKNLCARSQLYFIENDRVDGSCLGKKKLHLNIKGNSILARNFVNYFDNI